MSNAQSGESQVDGASLVEIARYEALATIVSEYLRHAAAVYQATVEAEGGVTGEARPYGFNSVELVQVVSTVKTQLGLRS
jgi:hypothetical protein